MIWFLIYVLIAYIFQEVNFKEYVEGKESLPDEFVVETQFYIWLWPIVCVITVCCILYFFLAFSFDMLKLGVKGIIHAIS